MGFRSVISIMSPKSFSYDPDAQAYFTANTAITSTADKNAINDFYLGLKIDGIYTKIKAMYLPIWGSASACKWNLINPVDTDAGFRLTFATGMTFTSQGMTGNGTSGYADTKDNSYLTNDNHLSVYVRTNVDEGKVDIGVYNASPGRAFSITSRATNVAYNQNHISATYVQYANTDSKGFYINSRTTSTNNKGYKNGTLKNTDTGSSTQSISGNIFLMARNEGGTPNLYATKQHSFYSRGNGLTDTDASNFSSRVNTLMSYFGINVY